MIYTSLAVLAMSASAVIFPLSNRMHLHPQNEKKDTRVSLTLRNSTPFFQDVQIAGKSYTIFGNHTLLVKAPVGTRIIAASSTYGHHRGDVLAEVSPEKNNTLLELK